MAEAWRVQPVKPGFRLNLDADEAGYLKELLLAHVAGALTFPGEPLGRILEALEGANVPERRIRNLNDEAPLNARRVYASVFAKDGDADSWKWWEFSDSDDRDGPYGSPAPQGDWPLEDDIDYLNRYR